MAIFNRDKKAAKGADEALATQGARELARSKRGLTVGGLEEALLKDFPAQDAEEWDRTGLLVGERDLPLAGVAIALDVTVPAIAEAAAAGANVLLTHHPAFLEAPGSFAPEKSAALSPGAVVWAAIQHQVALMDFHTALDVSPVASQVLPAMLGFKPQGKVVVPAGAPASKGKGYGQLCKVPAGADGPETLAHVAARCTSVQGRAPRVWGSFDAPVRTAVCATGSAGNVVQACLEAGVDCLVCGELRYHQALDASLAGLAIIELGHDVSELPLCAVLADACVRAGVPQGSIVMLDQGQNWAYPEAIRL